VSQTPGSTMTAGGRPLTAVRLGPLTCFCACTPAGAAAAISEEQNSEFFAEEVFDPASSGAQAQASLPPPAEESATFPAVVIAPAAAASQKPPAAAAQPKPRSLPEAVKESEGSPMKVIVDSSSAAKMEKASPSKATAVSKPAETKAADATKAAADAKKPAAAAAAGGAGKSAASAKKGATKAKAKPKGQPFKKQNSSGPPPPYCQMCVGNFLLRLIIFAVVLGVLTVCLMGALSIAQLASEYKEVKKAQSSLVDDTCSIESWNPLDEPPRSDSYEAIIRGKKWKLPKLIDGLDKTWTGVSCTVKLKAYGTTLLTVYDQKRWLKPWLSALTCSEEIPKLEDKTFPCSHLPATAENSLGQWGAFAASKKDISNVMALDVYWVTSSYGFPMAKGIPLVFTTAVLLMLVLLLARAAARRWRRVQEKRRGRICTALCCLLRWLLCLVLVAVVLVAGVFAFYSASRAHQATKEFLKTMEHGSCKISTAGIDADPSIAPPASYSITVGSKEFKVPSKNLPHTSLAWAIKSCYVHLDWTSSAMGTGFEDEDGLTTLTIFEADRLLKFYKPKLQCADLLGSHKEGLCSYAPNDVGGWGVLFGSKEAVSSYWMLFFMKASRSGTPFILLLVFSVIIAITVIVLLVMLLRMLCGKLQRRRRKAAAREMEPDVEALASSVPYRLLH